MMHCEWYKNSNTQMHDPDMEHLQSKDSATCAVWEWVKGECHRRKGDRMPEMSEGDLKVAARRLGIEVDRLRVILNSFVSVGWITSDKRVRSWRRWQNKSSGKSIWEMKQQIEMIEEARHRLKEWGSDAEKKEGLPKFRTRIRELKERIMWAN